MAIEEGSSKHAAVNAYFELLPKHQLGPVLELFSEDAIVWPSPMPVTGPIRGKHEIAKLYGEWLKVSMTFTKLLVHDSEHSSAVEIEVQIGPDKKIGHVVDVFDMTADGKISRMAAYKR